MISCESVYNNIFGKSFLATLDVVAFLVHLKMKYHNDVSQPILIKLDMRGTRLIYKATIKNSRTSTVVPRERMDKVNKVANLVDLDV